MPSGEGPKIKFDAYKHAGVTFHTVRLPCPPMLMIKPRRSLAKKSSSSLVPLTRPFTSRWVRTAKRILKSTIDKNATAKLETTTPMEFHVELAQVLAFAQQIETNPVVDIMVQKLKEAADNDTIGVTIRMVPRGTVARITVDEGVLRAGGCSRQGWSRRRTRLLERPILRLRRVNRDDREGAATVTRRRSADRRVTASRLVMFPSACGGSVGTTGRRCNSR